MKNIKRAKKGRKELILFLYIILSTLFFSLVYAQSEYQIYAITFAYEQNNLSVVKVQEGITTSGAFGQYGDHVIEVLSSDGSFLGKSRFYIPKSLNNGKFTVFAPRFNNAASMTVYDISGQHFLEIKLQDSESQVTEQHVNTEDNETNLEQKREGFSLQWIYVAFPVFLVAVFIAFHEIDRKRWHSGFQEQKKEHKISELRKYASANLKKGFSRSQISQALSKGGYSNKEIGEAFKGIK